ncbi:MAG: sigma-70 family RNA polymerase sigma factor [Lentimonas sp.]
MSAYTKTHRAAGWLNPSTTYTPSMEREPQVSQSTEQNIEDIDSVCLRAIAEGDRAAFSSIVERWQTRLINFFHRSTSNRSDAEDLAQETFIELYRAAKRYQPRGTFNAFIFTLARRRLIDSYRKKARRPLDFIDPTDFVMQQQADATDHTAEIQEAFHRALADLPDNQRDAILMLQQQGLSYDEIATALDCSLSAVKTWIHRARTHLRDALKDFKY